MTKVFLHSNAISKFGKHETSILELASQVAEEALYNFERERIDFLVFSSFTPDMYTNEFHTAAKLADLLRLGSVMAIRSETASSSGASAFHLACNLIYSGRFRTGIVVAAEIMSRFNRAENNLLLGSVLSDRQINLCLSMAQGGAMVTNLYFHKYGYTRDDLYHLAKKLHDNGYNNPNAQIRKHITKADYMEAPIFAIPLGLYDISPLSDGACAIVLSSDLQSNISVRGLGYGTTPLHNEALDTSFPASVSAFQRAYQDSGLTPHDIKVAELHDAFTTFELIGAEDAELFPRGRALRKVIEGVTHPNGSLPINTSGGLKSRGHPIGASGLVQIIELVRFMQKHPDKNIGLTHSIGGLATNNFATILELG
ncbi:MAG: thiolase family protein [Leptospiraceae bacterium]|nr:thiolase family protein [Leptospiraceae bacterium]MCP5495100.1 thiolase family protein [Leptospiraceae bacterium]